MTASTTANETGQEVILEEISHSNIEKQDNTIGAIRTTIGPKKKNKEEVDDDDDVAIVNWSDITIQTQLGRGSFSTVYKVVVQNHEQLMGTYACKCLPSNRTNNKNNIKNTKRTNRATSANSNLDVAARDLILEGRLLSKLHHKNIIHVYGVPNRTASLSSLNSTGNHHKFGYFLLLDLLQETLEQRLDRWRSSMTRIRYLQPAPVRERLQSIVLGIVNAMEYLHHHHVLLKDLKPSNIGFTGDGTVKLFDFGLARQLLTDDQTQASLGTSEIAGTFRYMAPECIRGKNMYLQSDIYSFGVVLWEIIGLKKPFGSFTSAELYEQKEILLGSYRPSLSSLPASSNIKQLIDKCWNFAPMDRPSFTTIRDILTSELSNGATT